METYNIALMNTVSPYFKDFEFPTNVELVLSGQYISTSVPTDPYSVDCTSCPIEDQLNYFGVWSINGGFGSINYDLAHNITNHFSPPGYVGLAYIGVLGDPNYNHGLSNTISFSSKWLTFIHELGHNFGMHHSYEEGEGTTGGFMDFGEGKWNGQYSWNPQYRQAEFEQEVNSAPILRCHSIGPAVADFSSKELSCIGSSIQFENESLGGATSYSWTFSEGIPATSIAINPSVIYSTSGEKTVSLTATNENGSSTITKDIIIIDSPSIPCSYPGSTNSGDGGSTFFSLNTISKLSGGCQTDGNYYFDYTCTDSTILEEGTTYNVMTNDLYYSQNITRYQLFIDYNNNGNFLDANETVYDGSNREFSFTTPPTITETNKLLRARLIVKLFLTDIDPCWNPNTQNGGYGQVEDYGVYFVDNSTLGILDDVDLTFSIFPNPTKNGDFTIKMPTATKETQLILYNSLGQLIYSTYLQPKVNNTIKLNSTIASGIYFIKVLQRESVLTKKLVIQ